MESVRIRRPETTGPRDSRGPTTLPIPTSDPHATTGLPPERYAELRETDLAGQIQFLAARLRSIGHRHANQLLQQELDLKVRQYSVLALAASRVEPSQRELSDFLSLDPSQIVTLVDVLEQRGLVERSVDPRDRRSRIVSATTEGRKVHERALDLTRKSDDVVLAALTAEERVELNRLLAKVAF